MFNRNFKTIHYLFFVLSQMVQNRKLFNFSWRWVTIWRKSRFVHVCRSVIKKKKNSETTDLSVPSRLFCLIIVSRDLSLTAYKWEETTGDMSGETRHWGLFTSYVRAARKVFPHWSQKTITYHCLSLFPIVWQLGFSLVSSSSNFEQ